MLITSKRTWGHYSMLGAYPRPMIDGERMQEQNPVPIWMPRGIQLRQAFFSRASLEKVVSTRVFVSDTASFLGAIFKYENGTERAVGECRVGRVAEVVCESPRYICITAPLPWSSLCQCNFRQFVTQVRFVQRMCEGGRGCCHPMVGEMRFWLTDINNVVLLFRPRGHPSSAGVRVMFHLPAIDGGPGRPIILEDHLEAYGPIWVPGQAEISGMAMTWNHTIDPTVQSPVQGDVVARATNAHEFAVARALVGYYCRELQENPMATALVGGQPAGRYHVHEATVEPEPTSAEESQEAFPPWSLAWGLMHARMGPLVKAGKIGAHQAMAMAGVFATNQVPNPLTWFDPSKPHPPVVMIRGPDAVYFSLHPLPLPPMWQPPPEPVAQVVPVPVLGETPGPVTVGSRKRRREGGREEDEEEDDG